MSDAFFKFFIFCMIGLLGTTIYFMVPGFYWIHFVILMITFIIGHVWLKVFDKQYTSKGQDEVGE